jgi:hypothetical protein
VSPRKLWNFAAFQAGWFACVLGGAAGRDWLGPASVAAILLVHLVLARGRSGEALFLAASLPLGLAINALLQVSGAVVAQGPALGPLWLLALWPLFASLFNESMSWMRGRPLLAVGFGAVGSPLSYLAGERLGALTLHDDVRIWLPLVIATWCPAMLVLLELQARLTPERAAAAREARREAKAA